MWLLSTPAENASHTPSGDQARPPTGPAAICLDWFVARERRMSAL
ncbi:MAG: hypothetical protein ACJ8CR_39300 [Roseiflexaceae bacterium]